MTLIMMLSSLYSLFEHSVYCDRVLICHINLRDIKTLGCLMLFSLYSTRYCQMISFDLRTIPIIEVHRISITVRPSTILLRFSKQSILRRKNLHTNISNGLLLSSDATLRRNYHLLFMPNLLTTHTD